MRPLSPREVLAWRGLPFLTSGGRVFCLASVGQLTASPSLFYTRGFQDSLFLINNSKLEERNRFLVIFFNFFSPGTQKSPLKSLQ